MSRPTAVARRATPPVRATTSTWNVCADRPLASTATGPDGSSARRSSTAFDVMYVSMRATSTWVGIVALSAIVNSPTTGRTPVVNSYVVRGAAPSR
ncbi:hypothetical protein [Polymorphospora lycopeni]|uniref:Uncharacterized protein n=1 Tax=Polymorphospora lycopeni TaxID=3140240 RepID=A0ABV5CIL9_9ACTN